MRDMNRSARPGRGSDGRAQERPTGEVAHLHAHDITTDIHHLSPPQYHSASTGRAAGPGLDEALLACALTYAARGWPVFPCRPRGKEPLVAGGYQAATTDPATIREWWARWPRANIGVPTGRASGLVVIDVDPRNGGDAALLALPPLPETVEVITGGGGRHLYFRAPNREIRSRPNALGPGVDLKAGGGYVLVPPSVHPTGRRYEWEASSHPDEVPVAAMPEWLVERLTEPEAASATRAEGERIPEGARNVTLTSLAGSMRRRGMTPAAIEAALLAENAARCDPPLPEGEVRQIARSVSRYAPEPDEAAGRPLVQVNGRFLRDVVADAVAALAAANNPPTVFLRGSELVRIPPEGTYAEPLTVAGLRVLLDRAADFVKVSAEGDGARVTPARPPRDVCESILTLPPQDAFPRLAGIRSVPVFLPDGRLLAQEGYDVGSGLLLRLQGLEPTAMPVGDALELLLGELLGDFPFADAASRAHALALLLEPFVRPLIDGPTPLYLIDAPVRGAGKGLLASACCFVATGRRADVMAMARSDAEEHEKRITALLLAGAQWVLIDNVDTLTSAPLSAVLTATRWRGRRLGKSELVSVPNDATWVATGNNVELSDEIARRCIPIRLDPGVERPEERTDFRHPDLLAWVAAHRAELVSACLSLVQAWIDAGRPEGEKTLGSYEAWARVLGGILDVVGVPGFLGGRERLYAERDRQTAEWQALCAAWWEAYAGHPATAKDIFLVAKERGLLLDLWGGRTELAAQQRFGHALTKLRDRVFGGLRICAAGRDGQTGSQAYRLEPVGPRGEVKTPETPETPPLGPQTLAAQALSGAGRAGVLEQAPAKPRQNPGKTPAAAEGEKPCRASVSGTAPGVSGVSGVLGAPPGGVDGGVWGDGGVITLTDAPGAAIEEIATPEELDLLRRRRALDAIMAEYEQHLSGCRECGGWAGPWCEAGRALRRRYLDAWLAWASWRGGGVA